MGFSTSSVDRLWAVVGDEDAASTVRRDAGFALAQWYLSRSDGPAARRALAAVATVSNASRRRAAFEIDAALLAGDVERACAIAAGALRFDEVDDLFRLANVTRHLPGPSDGEADAERLALVNRALLIGGLTGVRMRDADDRLRIANLAGAASDRSSGRHTGPTVSVIVCVRDMSSTLGYALESVTEQTYTDLDIVVVDDASNDSTAEIIREFAGRDARIRNVRRRRSAGAFVARNLGLRLCTGELVTVHDGDDWSHPEKIERQVAALLATGALATVSQGVRVTDELEFCQPYFRPRRTYVARNTSSLMFHRSVFDEIGNWDEVRSFGDVEFMRRFEAAYGVDSIVQVDRGVPLAFLRRSPESLTGAGPNGNAGLFHVMGSLHQYRRAGRRWHESDRFPDDLPYRPGQGQRPFPVPHLLDARRPPNGSQTDIALVGDFSRRGRRAAARTTTIRALSDRKVHVALGHVPRSSADVADRLLEFDDGETVRFLSSREHAQASLLVVDPVDVVAEALDDPPTFGADRVIVIVDDLSSLPIGAGSASGTHPLVRNLRRFGVERSEWWATDPIIRDALRALTIAGEDGVTVADELWPVAVPGVRRRRRRTPSSGAVQVGMLGPPGVAVPPPVRQLAGRRSVVHARGSRAILGETGIVRDPLSKVSMSEFLDRIDVAVWVPDGSGRSPVASACAAAAAGVPVVTVREMQAVLGAAALYSEPEDVGQMIHALVSDSDRYAEQSRRSRALVRRRNGPDAVADHLRALAKRSDATLSEGDEPSDR